MTITQFSLTDEDLELLPSEADVQFYAEHGWYLSKKLLTDEEVDALTAASDDFYAGARDHRLPFHPPKLAYWRPEHGPVQRHHDYVHYESDSIANILRKPLIGAVAARLAQAEEIRIFQTTMIYKPPIAGEPTNIVPWHFDKHYWSSSSSEKMLTAFIPFHDCGPEMGTITMVDGSHRWAEIGARDSTVLHFAERDRSELEEMLVENATYNGAEVSKVQMNIPKGHMSFHHCRTYHGSGPTSPTGRAGPSRCTCRTATTPSGSSGCPPANWPATTTTRWCGAPLTAGRTTPIRSTARCCGGTDRRPMLP